MSRSSYPTVLVELTSYTVLRQLPPRLINSPECPFDLRAFCHLRFLSLSHIDMPDGWSISDAPHLEILLIHDIFNFSFTHLNPIENEKKQETKLRIVGVKGDDAFLESLNLPSSVEHLALIADLRRSSLRAPPSDVHDSRLSCLA